MAKVVLSRIARASVYFAIWIFSFCRVLQPELLANEESELAHFLWSSWASQRQRLSTAEFEVKAHVESISSELVNGQRVPYTVEDESRVVLSAKCDWDKQAVAYVISSRDGYPSSGAWSRTEDYLLQWPKMEGAAATLRSPGSDRLNWAWQFDPRAAGLAFPADYRGKGRMDFADAIERIGALGTPDRAESLGDGRYRLVYLQNDASKHGFRARQTFVINEEEGYTVQRAVFERVNDDVVRLFADTTVEYAKHSGYWLPTHIKSFGPQAQLNATIGIKWESVNKEIPANSFGASGLGVERGVLVSDKRFSPSVVVGRVGIDDDMVAVQQEDPFISSRTMWIIVISGVVICIFVLFVLFLVPRSNSSTG